MFRKLTVKEILRNESAKINAKAQEIDELKTENESLKVDRINTMKALVELHGEILDLKGGY